MDVESLLLVHAIFLLAGKSDQRKLICCRAKKACAAKACNRQPE